MSDITKISILENSDQTTVDTVDKNLVVDSVTVGGVGGTTLTKTVLDGLIAGGGSTQIVDTITLSGTDETNKFVTLSQTPVTPGNTILLVDGAPNVFYGSDFEVVGNQLRWTGKALDGILASGDNITVTYDT